MPPPIVNFGKPDEEALGKLWIASIIFLGIMVVGFFIDFVLNPFRALSLVRSVNGTIPLTTNLSQSFVTFSSFSLIIVGAIELVALFLVYSSFKSLEKADRRLFHTPSILTLLLLIAVPLILIGTFLILSAVPAIVNSINQQQASGAITPTIPPSSLQSIIAGGALAGIAGIISIVVFIGGIMLGLWRVGSRYGESFIKASAILAIIPFLDILVPILILIGVRRARKRISQMTTSGAPAAM